MEFIFLPFPSARGYPHSLACGPHPPPPSFIFQTNNGRLNPFHQPERFSDLGAHVIACRAHPDNPEFPHPKVLYLTHICKVPFVRQQNTIHRFPGLRMLISLFFLLPEISLKKLEWASSGQTLLPYHRTDEETER